MERQEPTISLDEMIHPNMEAIAKRKDFFWRMRKLFLKFYNKAGKVGEVE